MVTATQLEPLLAGTQCTQCGFPSCAAYADALANHAAPPTLCRPGGARVAKALASKYGIAADRMVSRGVGPLSPVANNDSEDGQAKNRRVELVRQ
jgi:Na+-translocating ferredoxin:NAD+ oxidoreductase RNF subunit RnfB